MNDLRQQIERLFSEGTPTGDALAEARRVFIEFRAALTAGQIRAAEPDGWASASASWSRRAIRKS
jgi:hypothetical protein